MASYGNVLSVVERPLGTTLALAATAGDGTITVDDISKLGWPAGGLRIGSEQFIYEIDAAPDQSVNVIDSDEDADDADQLGTITLGGQTLSTDYDVDEPVLQFQEDVVTERIATVVLPDQAEEIVTRVPRHLWDRLPASIRDRDLAPETVALEDVEGDWVMTDVVSEDPSVDASYIDISTLPTSQGPNGTGTAVDDAGFFTEAWSNPSRVVASDDSWATAIGTSSTATVTPHNSGFKLPAGVVDNGATGTLAWVVLEGATTIGGDITFASGFGTTHHLEVTDFGFAVPGAATITAVTVNITRTTLTGTVVDSLVRLIKGGVVAGNNNASPARWPTNNLTAQIYGGDLWGTTLTPADVNASDFGVSIAATETGGWAQIDSVRIRVNYTTTSATSLRSDSRPSGPERLGS